MPGGIDRALRRSVALVLLAGVIASPARAADGEPRYVSYDARAAVTADIDRDGSRELVLVTGGADGSPLRTLEVWDLEHGSWVREASAPIGRAHAPGGPLIALDAQEQSLSLLAWRDGRDEHALLVTAGDAGDYGGGCCLHVATVSVRDGDLELRWLDAPDPRAEELNVFDADADGVDELLVVEPPDGAGDRHLQLLRWTGERFAAERISLGSDDGTGRGVIVGESDGIPGDEALYAVDGGRRLMRVGLSDGRLVSDAGQVDEAEGLHLWSWGAAGGRTVVQVGAELRVLRWPRGGEPATVARAFRPDYPDVSVVGDGTEALVVDRGVAGFDPRNAPSVDLLDLDLRPQEGAAPSEAVQRVWRLANLTMPALRSQLDSLMPYIGPFPGRLADGSRGYIATGNLVSVGPDGERRVRRISSLTGLMPVGLAGPEGAWWVLDDGHLGGPDRAWLVIDSAPGRTVSVVPADLVLEPDDEEPLDVGVEGGVLVPGEDGGERLLVADSTFGVTVSGDPGSLVLGVIDQWIVHEGVLPDQPVVLSMESLRRGDGNLPIEAGVVRIDPAGRVSAVSWEGEVRREPPNLVVNDETLSFTLRSEISGRASAGASVTVDGRPVIFNDFGAFHVEVDAPIWPREVAVVARDPVGIELERRIAVVGFLDYRGLPWAVIIGVATLAAGAFLFIRTPRRRVVPAATWGDARLEEIDAD